MVNNYPFFFCRNILVETVADLRKVRTCLSERCSVFGVTLEYKEGKFGKPERGTIKLCQKDHVSS